jgi:hypothetical protein
LQEIDRGSRTSANEIDRGFLAKNQICACFILSPSLIASRCAVAMSTTNFTPDLSGGGRPAGGGVGDALVAGTGMRTGTAMGGGSGGNTGGAGDIADGAGDGRS